MYVGRVGLRTDVGLHIVMTGVINTSFRAPRRRMVLSWTASGRGGGRPRGAGQVRERLAWECMGGDGGDTEVAGPVVDVGGWDRVRGSC